MSQTLISALAVTDNEWALLEAHAGRIAAMDELADALEAGPAAFADLFEIRMAEALAATEQPLPTLADPEIRRNAVRAIRQVAYAMACSLAWPAAPVIGVVMWDKSCGRRLKVVAVDQTHVTAHVLGENGRKERTTRILHTAWARRCVPSRPTEGATR
jgi:hypothetical protein